MREQASRVRRISTQEEEEKNQADMDYEPEKPYPRAKGKRKRQADSDSEEEAASSLTGSLDSSPGGGDTLEEQDDLGSPDNNEDREEGFLNQNGQEDIECQEKTEEEKNDEETKRNEPRICKLKSQKGSKDLNQNKEGDAVLGGCEKRNAEEGGNYAVVKLAKKLEVKKGKTVKAARRSDRHWGKSAKNAGSSVKRVNGSRPELVRDEGNMLSEDNDDLEAIEDPEDGAKSPDKEKVYLAKSQKNGRKPHQCNECEKKFVRKSHLKIHLAAVHRKEKDHQCSQCEKKFQLKTTLHRHMETVHLKVKPYQCEECGKKFS